MKELLSPQTTFSFHTFLLSGSKSPCFDSLIVFSDLDLVQYSRVEVKINLLDKGSKSLSCFEKTKPSHRLERLGLDLVRYSTVGYRGNPSKGIPVSVFILCVATEAQDGCLDALP